jgi:hypothetical protein
VTHVRSAVDDVQSHIEGKNADVNTYTDRVERGTPGTEVGGGLVGVRGLPERDG